MPLHFFYTCICFFIGIFMSRGLDVIDEINSLLLNLRIMYCCKMDLSYKKCGIMNFLKLLVDLHYLWGNSFVIVFLLHYCCLCDRL